MIINKPCDYCGEYITYDTYNDKWGDASPVVHIRTKRKTHILIHKDCMNKIGASGTMSLTIK